jgi:hypothetical protein
MVKLVFYFRGQIMRTISILLAIAAFFFLSCSSGNSNQGSTTNNQSPTAFAPAYDNSLTKGKVIDSMICQSQNSQSYALYLPSYYSPDKKFPCIYFFDSHARGSMPVKLYKDLAEKYGFVLIGSNVSKNGIDWPATSDVVNVLMQDSRTRINIDPQRICTSGFSGGSRVASSIAILNGGVTGVIGCAAGFPTVENEFQNKFDYFGMVGDYDFNLTEMEKLDETLEQNRFAHQLLTFDGKHDWPASSDFKTALLWIQVNAMKGNLQPKNDTVITALRNDYEKRIAAAKSAGDVIREHELLDGIARTLDGLTDVSSYKKHSTDLISSANFKNAIALQAQLQQQELNQQQALEKQFIEQDENWWAKKIAELNQNVHNAKTKQESQMNQRLINFLGLIGYMESDHALNGNDLINAANYLKTYKMADPQNPDCSYLTAVYYMKKDNPQQAISSLNEAASLGYSEVSQLVTDPTFSTLHDDVGFKNVVDKVKANSIGK